MTGDRFNLIEAHCRGRGAAITCGDTILTYEELHSLVVSLRAQFRRAGARSGESVVAALLPNCHLYLAAYFAALEDDLTLVPLNLRWKGAEIDEVLRHAGAELLIGGAQDVASIGLRGDQLEGTGVESVIVTLKPSAPLQPEASQTGGAHGHATHLYYTSGTTGRSKGVVLTRANLEAHVAMTLDELKFTGRDVWLHAAPMFHLADAWAIWTVTAAAGSHVILPNFDPAAAFDLMLKAEVTITNLIPAMIPGILDEAERHEARPTALRLLLSGGAPIAPSLVERIETVLGCEYVQTYGLTETSPFLTFSILDEAERRLPPADQRRRRARTGRAVRGIDLRVVEPAGSATFSDVPHDDVTVGEVVVRGPTVTPGYWRDDEATRNAFAGGWFHTGDLGTIDRSGSVNLVDRVKDVIVSGGETVYSIEVEAVLHAHPAILEAAVFAEPDERWGESVRAAVVLRDQPACSDDDLLVFCRDRLASYKCPRKIDRHDSLPRTGSGKIDKKSLRAPYWQGRTRRIN